MVSSARAESIKLIANTLNAMAILLLAASLFSDWVGAEQALTLDDRGWMIVDGFALHLAAHFVLNFLDRR